MSYKGLIYTEDDLYEHVKLRYSNDRNNFIKNKYSYKIDESCILLSRKTYSGLYDLIVFIDDNFNIIEFKNTYVIKMESIIDVIFAEIT